MDTGSHRMLLFGSGLLGSAILRAVRPDATSRTLCVAATIPWHDKPTAVDAVRVHVESLLSSESPRYDVYWCAGRATPRGDGSLADDEVNYFESLMAELEKASPEQRARVRVFVASSAGALYSTSNDLAATETTPVEVRDSYGAAKARVESVAVDCAYRMDFGLVVGRISSLFGPGQSLDKPQGLLNHVAWSVLTRQPVVIHVDRMSTRNYLHVADAADLAVECMGSCQASEIRIQNVCSHRHYSIAEIIQIAERTFARRANVIYAGSGIRSDLRVTSDHPELIRRHSRRSLASGFGGIATDLRIQFGRSGSTWRKTA